MDSFETVEEWRRGGRSFGFRGHRIFYRIGGSGRDPGDDPARSRPDPLILIHGFPTASWDWHRIWPRLVQRRRVVAADMIGFGFSAKPTDHDYSIFEQADLHEALAAHLGLERAHVLAHDYGDTVAQELLARQIERRDAVGRREAGSESSDPRRPAVGAERVPAAEDREREGDRGPARGLRILSACLLNGGILPEAISPRPIQRLLELPVVGALVGRWVTEGQFRRSFSSVFGPGGRPGDEELRSFWRLIEHGGGRRVVHRVSRYQRERRRHRDRWVGALRDSPVPLRFVVGPADPVSGARMGRRFREVLPGADLLVLDDGVGHYPQLEAPEAVLDALNGFQRGSSAPCWSRQ